MSFRPPSVSDLVPLSTHHRGGLAPLWYAVFGFGHRILVIVNLCPMRMVELVQGKAGVERVGEHEFLTTVEDVRRKTLKPTTISSSFAKTGIWPFDQ